MKATRGISAPAKAGDAGYDLKAMDMGRIDPSQWKLLETGACVEIPEGYCGIIIGRSSLNAVGLFCQVGLVDSGYRGRIKVLLYNMSDETRIFYSGDRIAQMVLVPHGSFPITVVDEQSLTASERGETGFGSTGR